MSRATPVWRWLFRPVLGGAAWSPLWSGATSSLATITEDTCPVPRDMVRVGAARSTQAAVAKLLVHQVRVSSSSPATPDDQIPQS